MAPSLLTVILKQCQCKPFHDHKKPLNPMVRECCDTVYRKNKQAVKADYDKQVQRVKDTVERDKREFPYHYASLATPSSADVVDDTASEEEEEVEKATPDLPENDFPPALNTRSHDPPAKSPPTKRVEKKDDVTDESPTRRALKRGFRQKPDSSPTTNEWAIEREIRLEWAMGMMMKALEEEWEEHRGW